MREPSRPRDISGVNSTDFANAEEIIEMLNCRYNGASSTGLSQDDILSSKTKWLVIDPSFYPPDVEGRFFFKLDDWTEGKHAIFTCKLISGANKFIISTSDRTSFSSIISDPLCMENKELKLFSHVAISLSLVHTLIRPVWLSFCKAFPENSTKM